MKIENKVKRRFIMITLMTGLLTLNVHAEQTEMEKEYEKFPERYRVYAQEQCEQNDLSYNIFCRVAFNESRFKPTVENTNSNGTVDRGLCQINDSCVELLIENEIINSKEDLFDPYKNIDAYVFLMSYHKDFTDDEKLALLRYQVGAGAFKNKYDNGNKTNDTFDRVIVYSEFYAGWNEVLHSCKNC